MTIPSHFGTRECHPTFPSMVVSLRWAWTRITNLSSHQTNVRTLASRSGGPKDSPCGWMPQPAVSQFVGSSLLSILTVLGFYPKSGIKEAGCMLCPDKLLVRL